MAMSIIADSLLLRLKLDCDVGYDMSMKDVSVVVHERKEAVGMSALKLREARLNWSLTNQKSLIVAASI